MATTKKRKDAGEGGGTTSDILPLKLLQAVSNSLGKNWKELGRVMGIEDTELDAIEVDNKTNGQHEMAYQMLRWWKDTQGEDANPTNLLNHLQLINRKDIADKIPQLTSTVFYNPANPKDTSNIQKDGLLSDVLFHEVASDLGGDWIKLGRALGIEESKKERIQCENSGDMYEMSFQILKAWREKTGENANQSALQQHLESIGRRDISTKIFKNSNYTGNAESFPKHENTTERNNELLTVVCQKLADEYLQLEMNGLPWMDDLVIPLEEYYVDLSLREVDKRGKPLPGKPLSVEDIFIPANSKTKLSRILIEGGPGMGKSTLAAKLAYDWANEQEYMKHFDLVVFIPLRHCVGELDDILCEAVQIKKEQMPEIFHNMSNHILVIMDGYDEISLELKTVVLPLLRGKVYSHATVIVTSRPGRFQTKMLQVDEQRRNKYADISAPSNHFIQKLINVEGISEEKQRIFVERFAQTCSEEELQCIMLKVERMMDKDFLRCPLFLLMIIVMLTENPNPEYSSGTKTGLYEQVFNFVIRRYFSKMKYDTVCDINLFLYEGKIKPQHISLLEKFSKFSLWAVCSNSVSFSREEILKHGENDSQIMELGFLTVSVIIQRMRKKEVYEPVHKSLLEFAAAYGLWLAYVDCNECCQEWAKDVISLRPDGYGSSLCFDFLMGLMGDRADVIFNALRPFKLEYIYHFYYLHYGLLEMKVNDATLKSLSPFLPQCWMIECNYRGFDVSENHKLVVQYGVKSGRIKAIEWNLSSETFMPSNIKVDTLVVTIGSSISQTPILQCKHLWLVADSIHSSLHYKQVLTEIGFEDLSLCLESCMLCNADHWFTLDVLNHKPFRWIRVDFNYYEPDEKRCLQKETLIQMIQTKRISRLSLVIDRGIDDLITAAANSELTTIILANTQQELLSLDLSDLSKRGEKSWEWVNLEGVTLECRSNTKTPFSISCLEVPNTKVSAQTIRILEYCSIKSLTCPASLLADCMESWPLCSTLTELTIVIDRSVVDQGISSLVTKLQNLQTLGLILEERYSFTDTVENWLLGSQSSLSLKGIEILNTYNNPALAKKLIEGICECLEAQSSVASPQTKVIQLQYLMMHQDLRAFLRCFDESLNVVIKTLKEVLAQKRLARFEIVSFISASDPERETNMKRWNENDMLDRCTKFLRNFFLFDDGFRIEFDLWGDRKDDTIKSQMRSEIRPRNHSRISVAFETSL